MSQAKPDKYWGNSMGIWANICLDINLCRYVDQKLSIPHAYRGSGGIKLFILGQDPTVKDVNARAHIKTVLNLDKPGNLHSYITRICNELGISLEENIYATNYLKNFFTDTPTQYTLINVFESFGPYWLPLLKRELAEFPDVPVITLGEPLFSALVCGDASPHIRDYWGYKLNWKSGSRGEFKYLEPADNILNRDIFPFPHQPSRSRQFYSDRFMDYIAFVGRHLPKNT